MTDQTRDAAAQDRYGLLDGFAEYMSPTDEDYQYVLRTGLVVIDTNVLLNLSRYHAGTRADTLSILEAISGRLFIPHQVALEYWRHREGAIREGASASDELSKELERLSGQSVQALSAWAERAGLSRDRVQKLHALIRDAHTKVTDQVTRFSADNLTLAALNTNADPILDSLTRVLAECVGPAFSSDQLVIHEQEAQRRIDAGEPPGFLDKKKPGRLAWGDYFVWRQLLDEAAFRRADVLLVTGDLKDDWWRRDRGETRGPRLELAAEFHRETNHKLFMLRPASLLSRAKDAFDLKIRKESVEAAERVDRYSYDRERRKYYAAGELYPLVKLPDGERGGYIETLIDMTALACAMPPYDQFIEAFQQAFPTITLVEEARRRASILTKLDLVTIDDDHVRLTEHGERLLAEGSADVLREQFMRRVGGASAVRDLAASIPLVELRRQVREDPPDGLSPTQAVLVLRYMEQLGLV